MGRFLRSTILQSALISMVAVIGARMSGQAQVPEGVQDTQVQNEIGTLGIAGKNSLTANSTEAGHANATDGTGSDLGVGITTGSGSVNSNGNFENSDSVNRQPTGSSTESLSSNQFPDQYPGQYPGQQLNSQFSQNSDDVFYGQPSELPTDQSNYQSEYQSEDQAEFQSGYRPNEQQQSVPLGQSESGMSSLYSQPDDDYHGMNDVYADQYKEDYLNSNLNPESYSNFPPDVGPFGPRDSSPSPGKDLTPGTGVPGFGDD